MLCGCCKLYLIGATANFGLPQCAERVGVTLGMLPVRGKKHDVFQRDTVDRVE